MNPEDGNNVKASNRDAAINNQGINGLDANRIEIRAILRVYSERRREGGEHGERGRDRGGRREERRDTESDLLHRDRVDNLYCVQSIADTDGNRPSPSSNRLKKRKGGKTLSQFSMLSHSL